MIPDLIITGVHRYGPVPGVHECYTHYPYLIKLGCFCCPAIERNNRESKRFLLKVQCWKKTSGRIEIGSEGFYIYCGKLVEGYKLQWEIYCARYIVGDIRYLKWENYSGR